MCLLEKTDLMLGKSTPKQRIYLSVVVSTFNRKDQLLLALNGLSSQTLNSNFFEVIVIDNNSDYDVKKEIINIKKHITIRFFNERNQGIGYVRDTGYKMSRGNYICFLDDDAIPSREYLSIILKHIQNDSPDCICGPIFPYYTSPKPTWFKDDYETRQFSEQVEVFPPGQVWSGSNMVWNKSILDVLRGFKPDLGMKGRELIGGEDTELFNRYWSHCPGIIIYDPEMVVYHWVPPYKMNILYRIKRNLAIGIAWAKIQEMTFPQQSYTVLRLSIEIVFLLLLSPVFFRKHLDFRQTIVEDMNRIFVRVGKLIGLMKRDFHIYY